ncbi:MAG: metallophosphoesterase [Paracoccaceae bacterium]
MLNYAIGDIHGHLDRLVEAHGLIAADRGRFGGDGSVVHVGDLVDRGPDSRGVIGFLIAGQARGEPWVVLKGNHDRLFAKFLSDPGWRDPGLREDLHWFDPRLGGGATLASYGVAARFGDDDKAVRAEALARVPAAHRKFLDGLPLWHLRDGALFVHAGIRPGVDLAAQSEDDLVWIRRGFLEDGRDHGALVVHGHSAIERATHYGNRLNVDSGVAYGGPLSAVAVEGRKAWLLTGEGRLPLHPGP